jgi:uncharacterized membrane protein
MAESNTNSRLEAFSDGVFAIALTLLILDIRIPAGEGIKTTNDLWVSLGHLLPSIFAFLLSFAIVFITWANHHAALKLVDKSSSPFVYANGFLLLTIVIIPFPTALLGKYLLTDQAAPAVVLYTAVDGLQAIGWILLSRAALRPNLLTKNEKSTLAMRNNLRNGYFALAIYTVCAVIASWYPLAVALLITAIWIGWLFIGIHLRSE